jgi:isochorismate hydrolase
MLPSAQPQQALFVAVPTKFRSVMATARSNSASMAPERAAGGLALIIIDMISCWDFPDGQKLLPGAIAIAPAIAAFKKRCRASGVPAIYANDNLGRWRSDFKALVAWSLKCGGHPAAVTTALKPEDDDYFVLNPKHSAFHATPMSLLLDHCRFAPCSSPALRATNAS